MTTAPRDLSDHDRDGIAGTIHTPDPAAVERLHALLGHEERKAAKRARCGRDAYDRGDLKANLARATERANERRRVVIPDDVLADARARHAAGETWAAIAATYGVAESTLWQQANRGRMTTREMRR